MTSRQEIAALKKQVAALEARCRALESGPRVYPAVVPLVPAADWPPPQVMSTGPVNMEYAKRYAGVELVPPPTKKARRAAAIQAGRCPCGCGGVSSDHVR